MFENLLRFANFRYFWWFLASLIGGWLLYASHGTTEPPNGGTWQDFTDRVVLETLGPVTYKAGKDGRPILAPPSRLDVDNRDGYFFTEPEAGGSSFASGWESRRLRILLEQGGQAPILH